MTLFTDLKAGQYEQVVHAYDADTGLRVIIAIHSTRLGPGLGGIRIREYESEDAALTDALRLAQAMSYKNACAGLNFGGAKAVMLAPIPADRRAVFLAMGRIVEGLNGRYVATEDMGMSEPDIAILNEVTHFAVGRSRDVGGSGDPSPHTAEGVFVGMRAALRAAGLGDDFSSKRVALQGCGKVGLGVIERLLARGAQVFAADTDQVGVEAARSIGAKIVSPEQILTQEVDLLAPCAVGAVLNAQSIGQLQCRAVAGGANNQLAEDSDALRLAERGIVYAPDFVINAGGVINVGDELDPGGYDASRVAKRVAAIEQTLDAIFKESASSGESTNAIALARARKRIETG